MEQEKVPMSWYRREIHDWSKTGMGVGKWYEMKDVSMDHVEFINAIKLLICLGEPLEFSNDFTRFRKLPPWNETFLPHTGQRIAAGANSMGNRGRI